MPRSMTGFGQASREVAGFLLTVEIRTVNARYFKSIIRTPEAMSALEAEIDQRLRHQLHRGSVHFTLRMKATSAEAAQQINAPALERYMEQLEIIRPDQSDIALSIDLATLLQLPGVCSPPQGEEFMAKIQPELMQVVDEAIQAVVVMRTIEGKATVRDLLTCCEVMEQQLVRICERAPLVIQEYHKRLHRRVAELTSSAKLDLDVDILAREVALFAERSDIAEELSRLTSHIEQFRAVLGAEEQPGRKLDFIAQEMLREANTIGAKANDADITQAVVTTKTAVDRIKEQVQNLE